MLPVALIFLVSCAVTIALTLRRPYLYLRARRRQVRVETYFLGALLGPVLILAGGLLTGQQVLDGLNGDSGLQPLGILTLFISMVFMSIFLDITGLFEACARLALRYARADGTRLFFALYVVVSVLTVFTTNDIVILTLTPFVYYFARHAGVNPKPYLVAEFFAANTWSMALYIGNPTNILLASKFGFTFVGYTRWMLLPTLAAGAVNALLLYLVFRREIRRPIRPVDLKPSEAITDRAGAVLGLLALGGCVVALAIAPYLGWEMWRVSLAFAVALLGILVVRDSYARALQRGVNGSTVVAAMRRVPWPIVPFVLSLFVTVYALRVYGVTGKLGEVLFALSGGSVPLLGVLYGATSALAANVLNNIPMTLAFASAGGGLSGMPLLAAALGTAIGSNLGANLTPIGALAGIMWMTILSGKEARITFPKFVRYGLLVTPAGLLASLGVLALQLAVGV